MTRDLTQKNFLSLCVCGNQTKALKLPKQQINHHWFSVFNAFNPVKIDSLVIYLGPPITCTDWII